MPHYGIGSFKWALSKNKLENYGKYNIPGVNLIIPELEIRNGLLQDIFKKNPKKTPSEHWIWKKMNGV